MPRARGSRPSRMQSTKSWSSAKYASVKSVRQLFTNGRTMPRSVEQPVTVSCSVRPTNSTPRVPTISMRES